MPVLVEHYFEHKHDSGQITVLQFLRIHYMADVRDADYERDMQLPFKAHDKHVFVTSGNYVPLSEKILIHNPVQALEKEGFIIQDHFLHNFFLSNIWQPPRVC